MNDSLKSFLSSSEIIDWETDEIVALAKQLRDNSFDQVSIAKASFDWVRDEIKHTVDFALQDVTCTASEVLRLGTGLCYAKSHLLAALLRANEIPAGLCYQRLSMDGNGPPYCLHGFNAVYLPTIGWYRVDARGNKSGIYCVFSPPREVLAFVPSLPEEQTFPEIWAEPLDIVVKSLQRHESCDDVCRDLPDMRPSDVHAD